MLRGIDPAFDLDLGTVLASGGKILVEDDVDEVLHLCGGVMHFALDDLVE